MAYALYDRLLRAVKASGLPYTVVGGAASRGRGTMRSIQTITLHHTATPRSYRKGVDYPTFNVVKNGRPGLPGPLAQLGLGRSGHVYLFAAGIANHAGRSRATSMTNKYAIGIEAEGANEAWPEQQYDAYVRLVRALLDECDLPVSRALRHAETCSPPGRKPDASFSGPAFRRAVDNLSLKKSPTPAPEKKGLFGMSIIATGINTSKRTIKAGQSARIPVGKYFSLATVKKGQTVRPTVRLALHGAHEEDVLAVSAKIVDYAPKSNPQDKIVGNFFTSDFTGTTGGGWSDHVYTGQAYKVSQTPRKGGSLRLQLLVTNKSKNPIDIRVTDFVVEGD
ncbi:peptidoglycan recognition protein family protein [Brevibacterium luteolum]|uniref:N-acetylmuramoyl-L-alanine amidase n=1 Tax=Brevibacterium luteolum TaxID=199591 RepID=A0A849AQ01_9MICO|nr:N-acetylmuramoyl-L-alanine amidase [Brevibacterium luteolum]MBM7530456.1 hypothetical protein [Brevibacterium luteolum]NNG77852.1 N-acetylmuramoyl-L-alanine amidase [Brevibacterium luteolum]